MALTTAEEALVRELIAQNPELLTLAASEAAIISKLGATKKNLSQLSPAGSLSDTDLVFTRQGSLDRAATLSVLKTFALTGVPAASETVSGIVELATVSEAVAGTDASRAVTPAGLSASVGSQIQPVAASVSGNALTLTLNQTKLDFRSATLTDGTINKRVLSAPISLVVSSGSTLGTTNAVSARLAILAMDNAGTLELAVANIAGGVNLDETTLISTTAEGGAGAADSASVVYSSSARTNLPFRVVGFVDITEATAGTWATAPTKVQGFGGAFPTLGSGSLLSANGYKIFSDGFILQWGSVSLGSGTASAGVTFPIAFNIGILATPCAINNSSAYACLCGSVTKTSMTVSNSSLSSNAGTATWLAWGR